MVALRISWMEWMNIVTKDPVIVLNFALYYSSLILNLASFFGKIIIKTLQDCSPTCAKREKEDHAPSH